MAETAKATRAPVNSGALSKAFLRSSNASAFFPVAKYVLASSNAMVCFFEVWQSFGKAPQAIEESADEHVQPRVVLGACDFPIHRLDGKRDKFRFHFRWDLRRARDRYGNLHRLLGYFLRANGFLRKRFFVECKIFRDACGLRFESFNEITRHSKRANVQNVHAAPKQYDKHRRGNVARRFALQRGKSLERRSGLSEPRVHVCK